MFAVESLKKLEVLDFQPSEEKLEYKKPYFTKIPTLTLPVKPKETATLIANIDGTPRPKGKLIIISCTSEHFAKFLLNTVKKWKIIWCHKINSVIMCHFI